MLKIISSKVAARRAIKAQLQREISSINEVIEKAASEGKTQAYYKGDISKATVKLLEKEKFIVDNWNVWDAPTEIFWYTAYNKIVDNESQLEEIAKESNINIVNVQ